MIPARACHTLENVQFWEWGPREKKGKRSWSCKKGPVEQRFPWSVLIQSRESANRALSNCALVKANFEALKFGKIPTPIKIKLALPPPPPPKNPRPPPLNEEFMGMGVFQQKEQKCQAPTKLAQPFLAPELRAEKLRTWGFFWETSFKKVFWRRLNWSRLKPYITKALLAPSRYSRKNSEQIGDAARHHACYPRKQETRIGTNRKKTGRGREKHIRFFNINFSPSPPKPPFWAPRKNVCASIPGKGRKKGTHINFFGGIFGVKNGVPNGPFSATKSLVYCFFSCP